MNETQAPTPAPEPEREDLPGAYSIQEEEWRMLVKSVRKGECVLLLGPGVSSDPGRAGGPSLPTQLALELAGQIRKATSSGLLVSDTDLSHVAQIFLRAMPRGRVGLEGEVEEFYLRFQGQTTPLHTELAALPFPLCITTVPDGAALRAFQQAEGKQPVADYYDFQPDPGRARGRAVAPSPPLNEPFRQPLVYELLGSLSETNSLVLTEDNLLEFLVKVTRGTPPLHPYLTERFKNKYTAFLFVGFGFHHWGWRLLLHVLEAGGHTALSLALEDPGFFHRPDYQQASVFFQSGLTLEFREASWLDFARELRRRVGPVGGGLAAAAQPPPGAPTVFLCHEHRDKPVAEQMADGLRAGGIQVWLDKQSLRGGDQWPQVIARVIEKQADYVLVLQGPHMLDKPESYFHLEIRTALERQKFFGEGFRFVVPVTIEPAAGLPLPNLEGLHALDWDNGAGSNALRETIQDDWARRQQLRTPATVR